MSMLDKYDPSSSSDQIDPGVRRAWYVGVYDDGRDGGRSVSMLDKYDPTSSSDQIDRG